MTFEEFQATRQEMTGAELTTLIGDMGYEAGQAFLVYNDGCHIERTQSGYLLTIENHEWLASDESALAGLEKVLYNWRFVDSI